MVSPPTSGVPAMTSLLVYLELPICKLSHYYHHRRRRCRRHQQLIMLLHEQRNRHVLPTEQIRGFHLNLLSEDEHIDMITPLTVGEGNRKVFRYLTEYMPDVSTCGWKKQQKRYLLNVNECDWCSIFLLPVDKSNSWLVGWLLNVPATC